MEDALHHFHMFNDVFLPGQAGKDTQAKANLLRSELVKNRKAEKETNAETLTLSKRRREMTAWRNYIGHELDVEKGFDLNFNFGKIHLMSHWVEQICRYGALQQYSADRHEQAQIMNLEDGWNASNHNLNYLPRVITFQHRILCFQITELNPQAIADSQENSASNCKVLYSGADWAAPLSSQSYVKSEFLEP